MAKLRSLSNLFKLLFDIILNFFTHKKVVLISESAEWVISQECKNTKDYLNKYTNLATRISLTPTGARHKILHFFSVNTLIDKQGIKNKGFLNKIHSSNKRILTWFHISENDNYRLKYIPMLNDLVDIVHTASSITRNKLINHGLREDNVIVIPLGVDTTIFKPAKTTAEKNDLRKKLNLPCDKIIIGSFQKDGNGWGEGLEPKMIKGPDIFCDAVEKLSRRHQIHVLLTGPARGYVKKRLEDANIPYTHAYLKNYLDIIPYYQILDLYLICSREEGGPKAILEAMATGVPLVSTRVGMAPEVIENQKNGFLCEIEDTDDIIEKSSILINDRELRDKITTNALEKIKAYGLDQIGKKFYNLYKSLQF